MTEKRYPTSISIILGISVVLMLFIFVLVAHHRDIPDQIQQHRGVLLGTGSSGAERIKPAGQAGVPAAEAQRGPASDAAAAPPPGRDGK